MQVIIARISGKEVPARPSQTIDLNGIITSVLQEVEAMKKGAQEDEDCILTGGSSSQPGPSSVSTHNLRPRHLPETTSVVEDDGEQEHPSQLKVSGKGARKNS